MKNEEDLGRLENQEISRTCTVENMIQNEPRTNDFVALSISSYTRDEVDQLDTAVLPSCPLNPSKEGRADSQRKLKLGR
jgi:hypothetical protein